MGFRSIDPFFNCATHNVLGQIPLAVKNNKNGQPYREFKQCCCSQRQLSPAVNTSTPGKVTTALPVPSNNASSST
jgi:hypothetical protein